MISVETYDDKYQDDVITLVRAFHAEALSEYEQSFNPESVLETIVRLKPDNAGYAYLLVIDGRCRGIIAGIGVKSMTAQTMMYQELIWYVEREYRRFGVDLLKKAEIRLKDLGFGSMIMAVLENSKTEKIKRLYDRLGYKVFETHFIKAL